MKTGEKGENHDKKIHYVSPTEPFFRKETSEK